MIQEDAYRAHLRERDLAAGTIETNISALRRIERDQNINLDEEFAKQQLNSLIERFSYSANDEREGRPNPTNIAIEPSRLRVSVPWYRSVLRKYQAFLLRGDTPQEGLPLIDDVAEPELEEAEGRVFKLEQDLQNALRANIAQLEAGLTIEDGGKEYKVHAGFIDILAKDKSDGWVVIELKAGDAKPESIAQILSYMSCVAEEKNGQARGILIASDFVPRVRLAARAVPTLALQRYRFNFSFEKV
jgi:hypothetical protein